MFPLSKEHWNAMSPYLEQAMELEGDDRRTWVEALRATDPALADEIQTLLDEHQMLDSEGFLESRAPHPSSPASLAGQTVGA
jgi:hypothetical protein